MISLSSNSYGVNSVTSMSSRNIESHISSTTRYPLLVSYRNAIVRGVLMKDTTKTKHIQQFHRILYFIWVLILSIFRLSSKLLSSLFSELFYSG